MNGVCVMEKCKAKYKNLNKVLNAGEQKGATRQWADQNCQNDEYLYQKVHELSYSSPPVVRKRFNPVLVDESQSWGHQINSNNLVNFSGNIRREIRIDFNDLSLIDDKSDCAFESQVGVNNAIRKIACLSQKTKVTENYDCKNFTGDTPPAVNSFWYVGFNKTQTYEVRPDWIADHFDHEIPAVCRAQTITIPDTVDPNSFLESVSLQIESNGFSRTNWGSPLYVQIFNTVERESPVRAWNKKKKKYVKTGETETIFWPTGHPHNALATGVFNPVKTTPGFFTILLDKPVKVNPGEHYAIVMLSPLSHWDHCPRIGGWGVNCKVSKDTAGDAFLSENNGRKWHRYGRHDDSLDVNDPKEYKMGRYAPRDFLYECKISSYNNQYEDECDEYLYLKPIFDNPIESIYLSAVDYGENGTVQGIDLTYEVSLNGRDWEEFDKGLKTFERDENGNLPRVIFIRAKFSTTNPSITPHIQSMSIIVNTELPSEMYVRTHYYNPKLTPMLGANVWGKVYAPFEFVPTNSEKVDCTVELIEEVVSSCHVDLLTVSELEHCSDLEDEEGLIIDESFLSKSDDKRVEYLVENRSVIRRLKKQNVYIKPYTLDDTEYLLSFEDYDDEGNIILGGIDLVGSTAYPMQEVVLQPFGNEGITYFGEWYDYTVDYDTDVLKLKHSILTDDDIGSGTLSISYNKIIIQDLTLDEIGDRINSETGLPEQGLILDYYKEKIFIGDDEIENRRISLRMAPVDPLRAVTIIRDDEEISLFEDLNFSVDYTSKELVFPVNNLLKLNDTLEIVYTPSIEDTGIAIGYRAKRLDLNHQINIKPNYIEYK